MLVILFDDMKEDEWNKIYSDLIKKAGTQEEGIKETSTLYDAGFGGTSEMDFYTTADL